MGLARNNDAGTVWTVGGTRERLRRLDDYKETLTRLLPGLPRHYVNGWSMLQIDALVTGQFLDRFPRKVLVLDIGTFLGVSAFHFAGHPKVVGVVSVDPSPEIADEINEKSESGEIRIPPEKLEGRRVLDVAREALERYPDEHGKVRLRAGVVGVNKMGVHGDFVQEIERIEVPRPPRDAKLIAFVDGLHTKEGVQADLVSVFGSDPDAIAIVDDCQYRWGPAVKAGVAAFQAEAPQEYRFRLFSEMGAGLATSNLGIVYAGSNAAEVEAVFESFGEPFDALQDLVKMRREEEVLTGGPNEHQVALQEARAQIARLHTSLDARTQQNVTMRENNVRLLKENSALTASSPRRRYKIADRVADTVLKVPFATELLARLMR